jgi:hypothetical protein
LSARNKKAVKGELNISLEMPQTQTKNGFAVAKKTKM